MLAQHQGSLCFTLCAPSESTGVLRELGGDRAGLGWVTQQHWVTGSGSLWCNQWVCSAVHWREQMLVWAHPQTATPLFLILSPSTRILSPCLVSVVFGGLWFPCRSDQFTADHIHHWPVPYLLWCCHIWSFFCCTKPPVIANDHFCFCYVAYPFVLPCLVEQW